MFYVEYEMKMQKLAKVKNKFMRFIWLYIGIFVLIIAGVITLLATKGLITAKPEISSLNITYGEDISVDSGSAFLSDVYYEYRQVGTDTWTKEKPTLAGTYEVRAVGKRLFGYSYSDVVTFTILPKEIELSLDTDFTYGSNPEILANLNEGDYIKQEDLEYEVLAYYNDAIMLSLDLSSLKILNSEGTDITSSYLLPDKYELMVTPNQLDLNISISDLTKTYDKEDIVLDDIEVTSSNLIGEDKISYEIYFTESNKEEVNPINAGNYNINLRNIKITNGDVDVSLLYDIKTTSSNLIINKRDLTLETTSYESIYNAKDDEVNSNYTITNGSLVTGDEIKYLSSNLPSNLEVGEYQNELSYGIFSDGINITDNYNITYNYGIIKISPKELIIDILPQTSIYNGESQEFEVEFVLPEEFGNNFDINYNKAIYLNNELISSSVDAGLYEIELTDIEIITPFIKKNYSLTFNRGSFTILPSSLEISISLTDYEYNGVAYIFDDDYVASGYLNPNDKLEVKAKYDSDILDVGTYEVELVSASIIGNSNNYLIYLGETRGSFNILPRKLNLYLGQDLNKVYDGNNYVLNDLTDYYLTDNVNNTYHNILINDDEIKVNCNYYYGGSLVEPLNVGTYTLKDISIDFIKGKETNYKINVVEEGLLEISPRPITIKPVDATKVYDDVDVLYSLNYELINGTLVDGEDLSINVLYYKNDVEVDPRDAGIYEIKINEVIQVGNFLISNYDITYVSGSLEITPRPITLTPDVKEGLIFNGNIQGVENYLIDGTLVGDDEIYLTYSYFNSNGEVVDPINAGTYTAIITNVEFINTLETNYQVTIVDVSYTISQRLVQISLIEIPDFIYNASYFKYDTTKYILENGTSFCNDDTIEFFVKGDEDIFNVGTYTISISGHKPMPNYKIEFITKEREFRIFPAPLTINFSDKTEIYNNEVFNLDYEVTGLVGSDKFNLDSIYYNDDVKKPILAGTYNITDVIYYLVNTEYSKDVWNNYDITLNSANTLTILQREVTFKPVTINNMYYKDNSYLEFINNLNNLGWDYAEGSLEMAPNDTLSYYYEFYLDGEKVDTFNSGDYTYNLVVNLSNQDSYIINYEPETLDFTIFVSEIILALTGDLTKVYDGNPYNYDINEITILTGYNITLADLSLRFNYLVNNTVTEPIYSGTYKIELIGEVINDKANYRVILDKDYYLTIEKRLVSYTPNSINNMTYNDSDYKALLEKINNKELGYEVLEYDFIPNDIKNIEYIFNNSELQIGYNEFNIIITLNNPNNYEVVSNSTYFTVYSPEVTLGLTGNFSLTYNGEVQGFTGTYNILSQTDLTLADLEVSYTYSQNGFEVNPINVGTYQINVQVKVNLPDGDIYSFVLDGTYYLTIIPKDINIYFNIEDIVYDGKNHNDYQIKSTDYISDKLYNADKIEEFIIEFSSEVKNVGEYLFNTQVKGTNTGNYNFIYHDNYLSITKRPITVTLPEFKDKVYDGNPYEVMGKPNVSNLVEGETLEVSYTVNGHSLDSIYLVDDYEIEYAYDILNGDINNYEIETLENDLTFSITKVSISISIVKPDILEKEYDGITYYHNKLGYVINTGALASRDKGKVVLNISYSNEVLNAGKYTITLANVVINNENNYNIEIVEGSYTYTINPKEISIEIADQTKVYDGKPFTTTNLTQSYYYLVGSDLLKLNVIDTNLVNYGTYELNLGYEIISGLKDNYKITPPSVTLNIEKRYVSYEAQSLTDVTYGDDAYNDLISKINNKELTYVVEDLDFIPSDIESITYSFNGKDLPYIGKNEFVITINLKEPNNYIIDSIPSYFIVYSPIITIGLNGDLEFTYNGEVQGFVGEYEIINTSETDLTNEDIRITYTYSQDGKEIDPINAGKYLIGIDVEVLKDVDIKYEFKLDKEYYLTINKQTINISPKDQTKVYDGKFYQYDGLDYTLDFDLDLDLEIKVSYKLNGVEVDPINVDTYDIVITNILADSNILNNYEFVKDTAKLEITKASLTITLNDYSMIYNGEVVDNTKLYKVDGLVKGSIDIKLSYILDSEDVSPIDVASYNVTYLSHSFIGDLEDNYEVSVEVKEAILTIEKAKLNIILSEVSDVIYYGKEYLPTPEYTLNGIFARDKDDILKEIKYIYLDLNNTQVKPINAGSYIVTLAEFTHLNYDIEIAKQEFKISPVEVNVIVNSDLLTYTYNGQNITIPRDLVSLDYTEVNDEVVEVKYPEILIKDAGEYLIELDYVVNNGVLTNYNIILDEDIVIIVKQKEISIETGSLEEIYDGMPHSNLNIDNTPDLVTGDKVTVIKGITITDVDKVSNQLEVVITDSNGNDVTSNYDINYIYGNLEITQRDIVIKTADQTKVYDGSPLVGNEFEVVGEKPVVGDEVCLYKVAKGLTKVGEGPNDLQVRIKNGNRNVTSNYNIIYEYGTLSVTSKELNILFNTNVEFIYKSYENNESMINSIDLVENESIELIYNLDLNTLKAGSYGLLVEGIIITNSSGEDVTDCYSYDLNDNKINLTVNKTEVTFYSIDTSFVPLPGIVSYPYDNDLSSYYNIYLKEGDRFEVKNYTTITIGETSKEFVIEGIIRNEFGEDVTASYNITYIYGTLSLTYDIYYKANLSVIYNGNDIKLEDILNVTNGKYKAPVCANDNIIEGLYYLVTLNELNGVKDAGSYTLEVIDYELVDEDGNPITDNNYIFHKDLSSITLTVSTKNLQIKLNDYEKTYDAIAIDYSDVGYELISDTSLITGHTLQIISTSYVNFINAGMEYVYIKEVKIFDSEGNDVTSNYSITSYSDSSDFKEQKKYMGKIRIRLLEVDAYTPDCSFNYDGQLHYYDEGSYIKSKLLSGHKYSVITGGYQVRDARTYTNRVVFKIVDENGQDVTSNYKIIYSGKITINKVDLVITINSKTVNYDGVFYYLDSISCSYSYNINRDELISYLSEQKYIAKGKYEISLDVDLVKVYDDSGNDITRNFNIVIESGYLEIV